MEPQMLSSDRARLRWRDVLDTVGHDHADVVIERYGKPIVAVVPYADYVAIQGELEAHRAGGPMSAPVDESQSRDETTEAVPATEIEAEALQSELPAMLKRIRESRSEYTVVMDGEPVAVLRPVPAVERVGYRPRTQLGLELWALRQQIVAAGEPLLDWDGVAHELAERRGEADASL